MGGATGFVLVGIGEVKLAAVEAVYCKIYWLVAVVLAKSCGTEERRHIQCHACPGHYRRLQRISPAGNSRHAELGLGAREAADIDFLVKAIAHRQLVEPHGI